MEWNSAGGRSAGFGIIGKTEFGFGGGGLVSRFDRFSGR